MTLLNSTQHWNSIWIELSNSNSMTDLLSMLLIYDKRNSFECSTWLSFSSSISNKIISADSTFNSFQSDYWLKDHVLLLSIKWSLTEKHIVYHLFRVLHQVLCNCLDQYLDKFFCSVSWLFEYWSTVDSFDFRL